MNNNKTYLDSISFESIYLFYDLIYVFLLSSFIGTTMGVFITLLTKQAEFIKDNSLFENIIIFSLG